jgi:hypothetical protein
MINSSRDIRVQQLSEDVYQAVELVTVGRKVAA